jgi:hypothetical protein
MGFMSSRRFVVLSLALLLTALPVSQVGAQGIQTSPYSAPSMLRGLSGQGPTFAPSNLLGSPGSSLLEAKSSESLPISSGMFQGILPPIPNLQFGYLYNFGRDVRAGRATADYLLPISLSKDSVLFGEAHTEFQSFWKTNNGFNNRVDMSFGGGYRTILKSSVLLGANGFYDASRLGEKWYSSGGLGLQMAALLPGNDAIDLNFNWYGKLFNSNVILNAFRFGPPNYDFQAGYSHELWNGGPDFRLSATGYMFDIGANVYGWNAGAELKSRDGMFVLKYDVGHDKVNQTYQAIGGFVNVGFQLENVLRGESPVSKPEPIFKSPRNLWHMLTQTVNRNWYQPTAVVLTRQGQGRCHGECCNLDRFLASITMAPSFPGSTDYSSSPLFVSFPAVPNTCLDPTKFIVVELDYAFDFAPTGGIASWEIAVTDSTGTSVCVFFGFASTDKSNHIAFTLNTGNQSAFTTTATDPAKIAFIDVIATGTTTLTITNVVIHFNQ